MGVLAAQQNSEWASPSFITPKKDGRVCWISNLGQLNKVIRCKQYPLPIITVILCKRSGYKFFTNLTLVCNTIRLNLTKKVKIFVPLLHHLANISTRKTQCDSNALQTLLKQLWKMYCQTLKMPTFTLMMLVLFPMIGTTMSIC
jgi:hypothetical protein